MKNFKRIQMTLGRWLSIPWYPLVFSAYPVLALLAENIGEVKPDAVWRPLLISIVFAGILFVLLKLLL
ncbi:MAG TPA: hypothetical protein VN843_11710, partial [Anaerolineales bacterium]|nr:hypothetical protein [Anaerolineales bacterium]